MPPEVIEEQIMEQPQPGANERLAAMLGNGEVPPPSMPDQMPPVDPAMAGAPAQATPTAPPPDPNAEVMAQLAAAQKQLSELQAQLPSDEDKKVLAITRGGVPEWEKYMALKNMDLSGLSSLDLLEMQFMESGRDGNKSHEERREIFNDRLRLRFGESFDPTDNETYGSPGVKSLLGEEADAYRTKKNSDRESAILNYEAKPTAPDFSEDEHATYANRVADAYLNHKSISVSDSKGNKFDLPVSEIPEWEESMKTLLDNGPGNWIHDNLIESDDKKRTKAIPERIQELAGREMFLSKLIDKVVADTESRVRAEMGPEKNAELKSTVSTVLGTGKPDGWQAQQFKNTADKLDFIRRNQMS